RLKLKRCRSIGRHGRTLSAGVERSTIEWLHNHTARYASRQSQIYRGCFAGIRRNQGKSAAAGMELRGRSVRKCHRRARRSITLKSGSSIDGCWSLRLQSLKCAKKYAGDKRQPDSGGSWIFHVKGETVKSILEFRK